MPTENTVMNGIVPLDTNLTNATWLAHAKIIDDMKNV